MSFDHHFQPNYQSLFHPLPDQTLKKNISLARIVKVSSSGKSSVTVLRKPVTQLYSEYSTDEYNSI
jgi:hypothetical protein